MTPQEHQLVIELFERLAARETAERDREAERAIIEGLRRAPNAVYALVQTVLVQNQALQQAEQRIREFEAAADRAPGQQPASFLDGTRETWFGRHQTQSVGSVPSVRPGGSGVWPAASGMAAPPAAHGGSFLGTAAAAAAGMIGGSLLLDGIRSMTGQRHGFGDMAAGSPIRSGPSPWGGASSDELSRQAGIDDIGRNPPGPDTDGRGFGLLDSAPDGAQAIDQGDPDFDIADADIEVGGDDSDVA
jgi:hypothetical protein